jgi:hypothetical protein
MVLKFLSRLTFLAVLIIIIPLAVQNRQLISLELNPLSLINDARSIAFTLPLFILIIITTFIGLATGLVLGWAAARLKHTKTTAKPIDTLPPNRARAPIPASIPAAEKVLEDEPLAKGARALGSAQDAGDKEEKDNVG